KLVPVGERSQYDTVQFPEARVLRLEMQRTATEPHHGKCRLLQHAGELPAAQSQRHNLLLSSRWPLRDRPLYELLSRLQQSLNLCFSEGPAIDTHFIQLALK